MEMKRHTCGFYMIITIKRRHPLLSGDSNQGPIGSYGMLEGQHSDRGSNKKSAPLGTKGGNTS